MKFIYSLTFVIILLTITERSNADPGCIVGGAFIYNSANGNYKGVPNFKLADPQANYRVSVSSYCVRYIGGSNTC